jgi:F-box interacting protein
MPDTSGATVFDDLPESIITQEIFSRLPSRDILRCGGVSKWWHGATSAKEFLVDHHRRQPSLPLAIFQPEDVVDALDIREAPPKRLPVLKYKICDNGLPLTIHASCDGLLLLSLPHGRFNIVNPATGQWLAIPRLTGSYGNIAGMYPHPHRSGKYGILFCRGGSEHHNAGYYVLTVGSSKKEKPRRIGPLVAAEMSMCHPPILLNSCLHWHDYLKDGLLVFDTMEETFRSMSLPAASRDKPILFETEGMLAMRCLDNDERIMKVWVLRDYERETWSMKCQIELRTKTYRRNTISSHKRHMLIYYKTSCIHQLHYDDNGKYLEEFQGKTEHPSITGHWFKESLFRHTFFPRQNSGHVRHPRYFRRL